ncbi:MAG: BatA domain-containing protein [Isosphaeraceae bacterium]
MTFAAPLFLLAMLAGIVPVVLHLIHRRRAREVAFPSLRFLKVSVQRTRKRKYIDDAALMALRVGLLVLLALGLARPAITSLLGRGSSTAVAIVLDNSGSMDLAEDASTRFETARKAAGQIVDGLREGDVVGLFLTGGPADPSLNQLLRNHATVRQELAEAKPSAERADLAALVARASAVLEKATAPNRELYVVTDNQALSWENQAKPADQKPVDRFPIIVVNVNRSPRLDAAVRDVSVRSPAPVAGVPVTVAAEVMNTSGLVQEKHVELHLDGNRQAVSPTLTLPPGGIVRHEFPLVVKEAGVHAGDVRLVEEDGCAGNDRRVFAIVADQQIPVAVLKPRRAEVPFGEDSFYLERALSAGGDQGAIRLTTLTPDELASTPLARFPVVFAVNLPAPDGPTADRLVAYVRAGGHLIWVAGAGVDPEAYNRADALAHHALLPAPLGSWQTPPAGGSGSWRVAALDREHSALAPLAEPATLYQSVLVYKFLSLREGDPSGVRVLARLEGGQPWLVERSEGAGTLLWVGSSLHSDGTNLPLRPLFLPLIARLTFHLAGAETERSQVVAGTPIVAPLVRSAAKGLAEMEVVRPSGETLHVETKPGEASFRYDDTHETGLYLLRQRELTPPRTLAFAVNPDPKEWDLAPLPRAEVERRLEPRPVYYCDSPAELAAATARLREGVSLRNIMLIAALVALVAETFLANRKGLSLAPAVAPPAMPAPGAIRSTAPSPPPGEDVTELLANL